MSALYGFMAHLSGASSYGVDFNCCSFSGIWHAKATVGGTSKKTGGIRAFSFTAKHVGLIDILGGEIAVMN